MMNTLRAFLRSVAGKRLLAGLLVVACQLAAAPLASAQPGKQSDIKLREDVLRALRDGKNFLKRHQQADGRFQLIAAAHGEYPVGITSLAILALINSDEPLDSPAIQNGLKFLRSLPPNKPVKVYEASLNVMALCAVGDLDRDRIRIARLVHALEETQCIKGPSKGLWGYDLKGRGNHRSEDRSNGQFAVLALRDAAAAGFQIDRNVWIRTHQHWMQNQLRNGGWGYRPGDAARGSMTAAGLSTLAITTRMLQDDSDVNEAGRPDCCLPATPPDAFEKGRDWLTRNFSVFTNPPGQTWHYYYLYGLERAARLGNVRFFGNHDWYREGARYLVRARNADGSWSEAANNNSLVTTSFAMLFLSKGLSRVVVNKLDYTSRGFKEDVKGDWNRHPLDVPNLVEFVDGLPGWPPRLTSQVLNLNRLSDATAQQDLNQAPVLYLNGSKSPPLNDMHVRWLREYIDEGGFIFAVANCGDGTFDKGFRSLVERMFPDGDASLQRLQSDHPVFRSEYPLPNAESIELYGVDFGCRTAIIYSPEDLGCIWQKWMRQNPPERSPALIQRIIRGNRIGTNILAYATGREPPVKLNSDGKSDGERTQQINRGLAEIAQLRHTGGWDTAPKALRNLLEGLNETVGLSVSVKRRVIPVTLDQLRQFPITYMHGRYRFSLGPAERNALRDHLSRGGLLFADACCGSKAFDRSFRDLVQQMFPDEKLERIPPDHELFSEAIGRKLDRLKIRRQVPGARTAALQNRTEEVPPVLEGIEIDGRLAVIYSRYDISCALENQASLACDGYLEEDAMKLAINVILYAMLQDVSGPTPHKGETASESSTTHP